MDVLPIVASLAAAQFALGIMVPSFASHPLECLLLLSGEVHREQVCTRDDGSIRRSVRVAFWLRTH